MKSTILFSIIIGTVFTGCYSKGVWIKPGLTNMNEVNSLLRRDDGFCDAVSYGAVPMPTINYRNNSYGSNGTFTAYNTTTGQRYSGTYSSRPNNGGFAEGMANGLSNGMALGQALNAKKARLNIWKTCMYNLGWIQQTDPHVHQEDLNSWKQVDELKLKEHSLFNTVPHFTIYDDDYKIVNYVNSVNIDNVTYCLGKNTTFISGEYIMNKENKDLFINCIGDIPICNNIFKIKDSIIESYTVEGICYTDKSVRPEL